MRTSLGIASKVPECGGHWIRERDRVEPSRRSVDDTGVIDAAHDVGTLIGGPPGSRSRHGAEGHRVGAAAVSQHDGVELPVAEYVSEAAAVAPALAASVRQLVECVDRKVV